MQPTQVRSKCKDITSSMRHQHKRRIPSLKYKNASLIRHHAPSSNAFPFPRIGTVKAYVFLIFLSKHLSLDTFLTRKYSLKYIPLIGPCFISQVLWFQLIILFLINVSPLNLTHRRSTINVSKGWRPRIHQDGCDEIL